VVRANLDRRVTCSTILLCVQLFNIIIIFIIIIIVFIYL